jgi:hypothetical protein
VCGHSATTPMGIWQTVDPFVTHAQPQHGWNQRMWWQRDDTYAGVRCVCVCVCMCMCVCVCVLLVRFVLTHTFITGAMKAMRQLFTNNHRPISQSAGCNDTIKQWKNTNTFSIITTIQYNYTKQINRQSITHTALSKCSRQ